MTTRSTFAGETQANPTPATRATGTPKLVAISGPSTGRGFAVVRATATIGRHPTNDFVVEDPRVSGVHLEITRAEDRIRVRDVGSKNGTWLGAHRIVELELATGAEVTIGDSVLRLEIDEQAMPASVAAVEAFGNLVGRTAAMRELFTTLDRVSGKELAILVQGEGGTGKEEVARAIHGASPRAKNPFVVISATDLAEPVAEATLFGREGTSGLFATADGGTAFIDGIGELSPALQAKLLTVVERRQIVPVGTDKAIPIDVRFVSATNKDLRNAIEKGKFREDLYLRLAQVRVVVPPLRQRLDDLPLLCETLLRRAGTKATLDAEALDHLSTMSWPGNVRELGNVLFRAAALAQDGVIRRKDVAGEGEGFRGTAAERTALDLGGTFAEAKERAIERFERAYLSLLMKRSQGNLSAASRSADVARHHLRDLLKKRGLYGVSLDDD